MALRHRHERQLRQTQRDAHGAPVATTSGRHFSLFAASHRIGEASTGLGVYFASVQSFIIAALMLW